MSKKTSPVDADMIRELADLLSETGLSEIELERDGMRVRVARTMTSVAVAPAAARPATSATSVAAPTKSANPATEADAPDHPGAVTSPMVGTV